METTTTNKVKVGLFLAGALAVTLISIFMMGGDNFFKKTVTLHAYFDQVQGLAPGSMVTLSGVRIGNVSDIQFIPDENKLDVILDINASYLSRITHDSRVEIRTQGALGDKYIYIFSGTPGAKSIEAGGVLEVMPSKDIMNVISERGGEAEKVFEIIDELYKFSKSLNQDGRTAKMIANLSEASESLKVTAAESKILIKELRGENPQQIREAILRLNSILEKIDNGEGSLGAFINDPSLHAQLKSMLGGTDRKKVIKSLIRTSIDKSPESNSQQK